MTIGTLPALAGCSLPRRKQSRTAQRAGGLALTADGAGGSRLRGPAAVACTYVRYSSLAWVPDSPGLDSRKWASSKAFSLMACTYKAFPILPDEPNFLPVVFTRRTSFWPGFGTG